MRLTWTRLVAWLSHASLRADVAWQVPFACHSFSKDQPITCSSAATINQSSFATSSKSPPSSSSVFSVTSSDRASPSVKDQKSNVEELIGLPDLVALPPSHKIKVTVPQGRLAGNTFTHKAQIHIPTSALQTILKNGKLVSSLWTAKCEYAFYSFSEDNSFRIGVSSWL